MLLKTWQIKGGNELKCFLLGLEKYGEIKKGRYISIIKVYDIFACEFWIVDILDNIQQVRNEMENISKTLDTLGKIAGKTKYGGQCEEINSVNNKYLLSHALTIGHAS